MGKALARLEMRSSGAREDQCAQAAPGLWAKAGDFGKTEMQ